ncbi:MAG: hypothetical protein NE330_00495, partial [Lentisphaeraceae bacterium]|nr:hypothetical protein [Lentisphaeraceae bacterium]
MWKLVLSGLLLSGLVLTAQDRGEPPVKAPYPKNLDKAATNKWWTVAKDARDGKLGNKRHPKNSITVTGQHFLDLEVDRDKVVAFAIYTVHN